MLVGNGEKVLVSVASVAVNRRMASPSSPAKLGRCRRHTATEGSEALDETHDPSVGVRRRHLPLLRKGRNDFCYGTIPSGNEMQCRAIAPGVVSQMRSRCFAM